MPLPLPCPAPRPPGRIHPRARFRTANAPPARAHGRGPTKLEPELRRPRALARERTMAQLLLVVDGTGGPPRPPRNLQKIKKRRDRAARPVRSGGERGRRPKKMLGAPAPTMRRSLRRGPGRLGPLLAACGAVLVLVRRPPCPRPRRPEPRRRRGQRGGLPLLGGRLARRRCGGADALSKAEVFSHPVAVAVVGRCGRSSARRSAAAPWAPRTAAG